MEFVILIILSYLLGSIPFGYLIAKAKNVDIQKVGSGNIGATNVGRTLGKKYFIFTLILDTAKGLVAISLVNIFFTEPLFEYYILAGSLAVLGHKMPVWLNWKGGKVVATSLGVLLGLTPDWFIAVILSVFLIILLIAKKFGSKKIAEQFVALGSISAAVTAVIIQMIFGGGFNAHSYKLTLFIIGIALLIIIAHQSNIKKMLPKRKITPFK